MFATGLKLNINIANGKSIADKNKNNASKKLFSTLMHFFKFLEDSTFVKITAIV